MIRYTRILFLMLVDALLINVSAIVSLMLRFEDYSIPKEYFDIFIRSFLIITLLKVAVYYIIGLYRSLWYHAGTDELIQIFVATCLGDALALAYGLVFNRMFPIPVYVISWLCTFILVGGSRMAFRIYRRFRKYLTHGSQKNIRTMIIGAGEVGSMVIREIREHPELNYVPVVVIDDDKWKLKTRIHNIPVVGDRYAIRETASKYGIDQIIVAIPSASRKNYSEILHLCKETKCRLKTLPSVAETIQKEDISVRNIRDVSIEDLLGREEVQLDTKKAAGYLKGGTILVTGGGGSIGSELCRQIAGFKPERLIIYDIYENSAYDLQNELRRTYKGKLNLEVVIGSVRDTERLEQVFEQYRPGIVFHAAAHKHVPLMEDNPGEAVKNNVLGTLNVAQCADWYGVRKFVLISTDKAVNPTNIMGATKRMAEMIVQSLNKTSKTEFVAVRFGNVLGSNGSVIPLFKKQIEQGGPVTVTHPDIVRYFMTIPEAVRLVIEAGALAKGGEIFVLDMGQPVKILDLAEDLIKLSGLEPGVDINIVYTGLRPGEKLYEELLLKEEGLQKTENKKIFVGKPADLSFNEIIMRVNALKNCLNDPDNIRECMAKVVPTYQCTREQPKADAQPKAVAKPRALAKPRAAAKFKAAASQPEAVGQLEAADSSKAAEMKREITAALHPASR